MEITLRDSLGNTAELRTAKDGTVGERQYDLACRKLHVSSEIQNRNIYRGDIIGVSRHDGSILEFAHMDDTGNKLLKWFADYNFAEPHAAVPLDKYHARPALRVRPFDWYGLPVNERAEIIYAD